MVSALALAQREELAEVEEEIQALEVQLLSAQKEELTLQPRRGCPNPEAVKPGSPQSSNSAEELVPSEQLEAEIQVMEREVCHFREQLEHLQNSERLRMQELDQLSYELTQAAERLNYEQQTVRTHEHCLNSICSSRSSPNLIGPRTIELRAEQRLKELAARRAGRLSDEVMRLAVGASMQQNTVDTLSTKLLRVRSSLLDRDRELIAAQKTTAGLESRLALGVVGGAATATSGRCMPGKAPLTSSSTTKNKTGATAPRKAAKSTGRLPQLSF